MNTEKENKEAPAEVEAPGKKLTRTQRRQLERRAKKLDEKKLARIRKTPEYRKAWIMTEEYFERFKKGLNKVNQPGSPQR